jgi:hypothetical protein
MRKPEISAIQHGNRRVEYRARSWVDWLTAAILLGTSFALGLGVGFSTGVDRGTEIGITSCAAGDSVAVDPVISEGLD